jgi:hypothetical protein
LRFFIRVIDFGLAMALTSTVKFDRSLDSVH